MLKEIFLPNPPRRKKKDIRDYHVDEGGEWDIIDSTFHEYMVDFSFFDSAGKLQRKLDSLEHKDNPVIIDLLSSPTALRSIAQSGLRNFKGYVVGYDERRNKKLQQFDADLGITYITDNLRDHQTWDNLQRELGDKKADIIVERGYAGLTEIPFTAEFYMQSIQRIWNMLSPDGGIAMLQLPPLKVFDANKIPIIPWLVKLEQAGITHEYTPSYITPTVGRYPWGFLRLEKNADAPLPDCTNYGGARKSTRNRRV